MSWLFCCGDQKQKALESKSTLDLSKPIMQVQTIKHFEEDDVTALSGQQSHQSKLLQDILVQKRQQSTNKAFKSQKEFQYESDSEETPKIKSYGEIHSAEQNQQIEDYQTFGVKQNAHVKNSQRIMNEKKLNNYLIQAQKMIQQNSPKNDLKRQNDEYSVYGQDTRQTEQLSIYDSDQVRHHQNYQLKLTQDDVQNRIKHGNSHSSNTSKTRIESNDMLGHKPKIDKARKSHANAEISQTQTMKIEDFQFLEPILEIQSNVKNQKKSKNLEQITSDLYGSLERKNLDSKIIGVNQPQSAKNEFKQENIFSTQNQINKRSNLNLQVNIQNKAKGNDIKKQLGQGQSRNAAQKNQVFASSTTDSYLKKSKNSQQSSSLGKMTSPTFGRVSQQIMNKTQLIQKQNISNNNISNLKVEQQMNSSIESQKEIFPSLQSEFSFQPKYFKPQNNKGHPGGGISQLGLSQDQANSSATLPGTRFFESMSSQKLALKQNQLGSLIQTQHINDGSLEMKQGLYGTPGYSASSTIIPNTRNPSIIPNMIQPSFLVTQSSKQDKQSLNN
ncbi:UNKNOWN [Stylonychia lemnae]|uniref:Uncharacterized protein n=1 Tax=Stylonychia lemnae TaxID=5949 RepID=A0A078A453_STYLE|nr:UNKNOWN [Stylonychia lemnae]|eukprot:CDW76308.1 UNKNOWN [Stylonychia lemnae]